MVSTNYAVAPGTYLEEWLADQGMSQGEAAARLGCSRKQVNETVNVRAPITAETATRLARLTQIPPDAWLRYEALYRADLGRIRDEEDLARHVDEIHPAAATYLRRLGATRATRARPGQLVSDYLAFHRCGTWGAYEQVLAPESSGEFALATLTDGKADLDRTLLSTWLRAGELDKRFERGSRGRYDDAELRAVLPRPRRRAAHPDDELLNDVGKMTPTRRLGESGPSSTSSDTSSTILAAMSTWSTRPPGSGRPQRRRLPNAFAMDTLFGPDGLAPFKGLSTDGEIRTMASNVGVAPGVAVHQMHRSRMLPYTHGNRLAVEIGNSEA